MTTRMRPAVPACAAAKACVAASSDADAANRWKFCCFCQGWFHGTCGSPMPANQENQEEEDEGGGEEVYHCSEDCLAKASSQFAEDRHKILAVIADM